LAKDTKTGQAPPALDPLQLKIQEISGLQQVLGHVGMVYCWFIVGSCSSLIYQKEFPLDLSWLNVLFSSKEFKSVRQASKDAATEVDLEEARQDEEMMQHALGRLTNAHLRLPRPSASTTTFATDQHVAQSAANMVVRSAPQTPASSSSKSQGMSQRQLL